MIRCSERTIATECLLEVLDRFRTPLAEKRIRGILLSEKDSAQLEILDAITDDIFRKMPPDPEIKDAEKLALDYAKSLTKKPPEDL